MLRIDLTSKPIKRQDISEAKGEEKVWPPKRWYTDEGGFKWINPDMELKDFVEDLIPKAQEYYEESKISPTEEDLAAFIVDYLSEDIYPDAPWDNLMEDVLNVLLGNGSTEVVEESDEEVLDETHEGSMRRVDFKGIQDSLKTALGKLSRGKSPQDAMIYVLDKAFSICVADGAPNDEEFFYQIQKVLFRLVPEVTSWLKAKEYDSRWIREFFNDAEDYNPFREQGEPIIEEAGDVAAVIQKPLGGIIPTNKAKKFLGYNKFPFPSRVAPSDKRYKDIVDPSMGKKDRRFAKGHPKQVTFREVAEDVEPDEKEPSNLIKIPVIRQSTGWSCGAAAIQSVLSYYGKEMMEEEVIEQVGSDPENGTEVSGIVDLAEKAGFETEVLDSMEIEDLFAKIDEGIPVITSIQAWKEGRSENEDYSDQWDEGHFVVVIGYDEDNVYLMDPSVTGTYSFVPLEEFIDRWHDVDSEEPDAKKLIQMGIVIYGEPQFDPNEIVKTESKSLNTEGVLVPEVPLEGYFEFYDHTGKLIRSEKFIGQSKEELWDKADRFVKQRQKVGDPIDSWDMIKIEEKPKWTGKYENPIGKEFVREARAGRERIPRHMRAAYENYLSRVSNARLTDRGMIDIGYEVHPDSPAGKGILDNNPELKQEYEEFVRRRYEEDLERYPASSEAISEGIDDFSGKASIGSGPKAIQPKGAFSPSKKAVGTGTIVEDEDGVQVVETDYGHKPTNVEYLKGAARIPEAQIGDRVELYYFTPSPSMSYITGHIISKQED